MTTVVGDEEVVAICRLCERQMHAKCTNNSDKCATCQEGKQRVETLLLFYG